MEAPAQSHRARTSGHVVRSAGVISLFTLLSRILGLLRDIVIAAAFKRRATDAFFVAFTIPNVLRRLLAEGSLTVAFMPVYAEYRINKNPAAARSMLAHSLGTSAVLLAIVSCLGIILAPLAVKLFAYGLLGDPGKFELAVHLTRLLFPFLFSVGLVALAMGALNTHDHFSGPALAPALLNLCIIATIWFGSQRMHLLGLPPVSSIALGVLIGGILQVLAQIPALARHRLLVRPRIFPFHPAVIRVAKLMVPSLFGLAIYQINIILSRLFASLLAEGSISALYYAQRLIEFPLGIFAAALATVAMPEFSRFAAETKINQLKASYRQSIQLLFFLLLPATAGLLVLAFPLITVFFMRGAFSESMARHTARTLQSFALGLGAAGAVRQSVPVFFALQDMRTPVRASFFALLLYAAVAFFLFRPLGTPGLALAVVIATTGNLLFLIAGLRKRLGSLGIWELTISLLRSSIASIACATVAWSLSQLGSWRGLERGYDLCVLVAAVLFGIGTYLWLSYLLGSPELAQVWRALRHRSKEPPRSTEPSPER